MVFSILELWCLDSMLVVQLPCLHSAFMELCCHNSSFIYHICILHFGIVLPRIHVPLFFYGMCILELCCLDSMIIDYLRTVFEIQRIYCAVIMLPRFHRVRTRWPGNNLWARLMRGKLEPISRIIWKGHLQNEFSGLSRGGVYTRACWTRVFLQIH